MVSLLRTIPVLVLPLLVVLLQCCHDRDHLLCCSSWHRFIWPNVSCNKHAIRSSRPRDQHASLCHNYNNLYWLPSLAGYTQHSIWATSRKRFRIFQCFGICLLAISLTRSVHPTVYRSCCIHSDGDVSSITKGVATPVSGAIIYIKKKPCIGALPVYRFVSNTI